MKQKLDIDTWARKEHFNFFNQFDEPYYGVCINVDCTRAYQTAKEQGVSFFLSCIYHSLSAAQVIEPFKYRVNGNEIFIYDRIDAASTIARNNSTFGFGYFEFHNSFTDFITLAGTEVKRVQGNNLLERSDAQNVIRYSALPWIDFTGLSHARMFAFKDSCPKISFGKMTGTAGKRSMPVAIDVHHALVDGLHVGQYINCFQEMLDRKM